MGKQRKTILVLLMTALVSTLFLAACGNKDENGTAAQTSSSPQASEGQTEPTQGPPTELSIYSYYYDKVTGNEPIIDAIQKKLNIKLKFVSVPYEEWGQKMNVLFASGEVPDIIMNAGYGSKELYLRLIDEGLLLPISDYSAQYPNLDKELKKYDSLKIAQGGKHYGLPIGDVGSEVSNVNNHLLYIRQDWLDKLKLQPPKTIDEFYKVAEAFAKQDPDGNGKADTFGFSTSNSNWWAYPVYNAFDASTDRWRYVDGQWQPEVITDQLRDGVAFLNKMYREKILDPDFVVNIDEQLREKFISGKVGMIFNNGGTSYNTMYDKFKSAYPGKDPKSMFTYASVALAGPDGNSRADAFSSWWAATSINAGISDEKKTKALQLLDYLLSDEGLNLTRYGVEGVEYKKDGDKNISLLPKDEKGAPKPITDVDQGAQLKFLVTWDNSFLPDDIANRDVLEQIAQINNPYLREDKLAYVNIDSSKLDPAVVTQLTDYTTQELLKLIVNSKDIAADWPAFVNGWKSKGGDKLVQETNAVALASGIKE